jgi:hypothetical protein
MDTHATQEQICDEEREVGFQPSPMLGPIRTAAVCGLAEVTDTETVASVTPYAGILQSAVSSMQNCALLKRLA